MLIVDRIINRLESMAKKARQQGDHYKANYAFADMENEYGRASAYQLAADYVKRMAENNHELGQFYAGEQGDDDTLD